jgi:hypothetical protein
MYNLELSPSARLLFYLIDDLSGDDMQTWTRWQKMALRLGLSRTAFFERVAELKAANVLTLEREGNRIYYKMQTVPKSGMVVVSQSRKAEWPVPKSGMAGGSLLITDPDHDPVAFSANAECESQPLCFRCRDTGTEILGARKACQCQSGIRLRRSA